MKVHGKAFVEVPTNGAWAICDRCSFLFNKSALRKQFDYRGGQMADTGLLVCWKCEDAPFTPNKAIQIPVDPEPILDARPETMIVVDD